MIVIVDYGMGNLFSIQAALQYLGVESVITADQEAIERADKLILPGVGSFAKAMENLNKADLIERRMELPEDNGIQGRSCTDKQRHQEAGDDHCTDIIP